ncbi:SDR family oxidoreductase [Paenibacillus radicis (ex Gao et al. 2016)]|uniref:Oxidoreductase DltE n=1 Tax=Paenibacillus radicis (ex Gao et al. 2016) TaxID=1737354 RepID=A0A917HG47_9BACL|nr:SDR family NAD(P)-dependent oxidoreductase [Paenibacillus radicis (ex Gao et al. 2016)]GGG77511.1 putative oxidoreductase DltE [Paenibacillus radicis (ex Gao et al. 2016)]
MKLDSNTILITGGASGIGLALAERWIKTGNKVIIVGRREDKLAEAKALYPELHTYRFDVSKEEERLALFNQVAQEHPDVNVLLNNAGVMRFIRLDGEEPWKDTEVELSTNLAAPIHLSMLFTPHLKNKEHSAILNVTSGLAHVPTSSAPVYSATKAALHSFTLTLRHQLAQHGVQVIEICPPHTNTDLGAPGANTAGVPLEEYADAVMESLAQGENEITYGWSKLTSQASRAERDEIFKQLNGVQNV